MVKGNICHSSGRLNKTLIYGCSFQLWYVMLDSAFSYSINNRLSVLYSIIRNFPIIFMNLIIVANKFRASIRFIKITNRYSRTTIAAHTSSSIRSNPCSSRFSDYLWAKRHHLELHRHNAETTRFFKLPDAFSNSNENWYATNWDVLFTKPFSTIHNITFLLKTILEMYTVRLTGENFLDKTNIWDNFKSLFRLQMRNDNVDKGCTKMCSFSYLWK